MVSRYETISITVTAVTPKAIQVDDAGKKHWIPKSLIDDDPDDLVVGEITDIAVQQWFLNKEGMI